MTYDGINIGEAVQPIQDRVETFQSNGYAIINPGDVLSAGAYAVTVNSGNLDASDTLSVGSSNDEVLFDGSTKNLSSATNIGINSVSAAGDGTEQYRYDVIYADSNGEVQKTEGSVTKLDSRESQNNLTRFERFKAAIPNPGTDPSVIIAAVIVNSNDSSVGTGQLRDYRVSATHKVSALEADSATINNHPAQDPRELLKYIDVSNTSALSETVAGLSRGNSAVYKIEVLDYSDGESGANNPLSLDVSGIGTGNWDYTLKDQTGSFSQVFGADNVDLINPTASASADHHAGFWKLTLPLARPVITGGGGPSVQKEGEYLDNTQVQNDDVGAPFDLTFEATASGNDLGLQAAVWQVKARDEI